MAAAGCCNSSLRAAAAVLLLLSCVVFSLSEGHVITEGNVHQSLKEIDAERGAPDCQQVDEECDIRQTGDQGSPVCGTNGDTYLSICHLGISICRGGNVKFKHDGACTTAERCHDKRRTALEDRKKQLFVYVPQCMPDGSFEPMQCHTDTGYCWCVTPEGNYIINATADGPMIKYLNCSNAQSEGCTIARRSVFIDNMVKHLLTEYLRLPQAADSSDQQESAIIWKFMNLDLNSDGELGRREYRDIRRLVRRNVDPKICSKNFPLLCDQDKNGRVSLHEWKTCWESPLQPPAVDNRIRGERPKTGKKKRRRRPNSGRGRGGNRRKGGRKTGSSCLLERQAQMGTNTYVPVCDNKGRYRRYQCFGSQDKWFCWCVSVRTGRQLDNTTMQSINNNVPQCDSMLLPAKPWPKCKSDHEERNFLDRLLQYFNSSVGGDASMDEDTVMRRMFESIDANNNNRLDRREKKVLQRRVISVHGLKKCGRHIHKVCDADDDRIISALEWSTCIKGTPRTANADQHSRGDGPRRGLRNRGRSWRMNTRRCRVMRLEARRSRQVGVYLPQCNTDGSFQHKQCRGDTGFCWCVNSDGANAGATPVNGEAAKRLNCSHHDTAGDERKQQDEPTTEMEPDFNEINPFITILTSEE